MKHVGSVRLETERLLLLPFDGSEAEMMTKNWVTDPDVTRYLTWQPHESVEATQSLINLWVKESEKDDYYHWKLVLKEINEPIGSISVVSQKPKIEMVHIGYCIGKKWWHRGFTSEAMKELIRFFFEEVGVNRVESLHDPANPHSGHVMRKCGMKYEGTLRQADWNNQGICDAAYYGLLKEDYFGA